MFRGHHELLLLLETGESSYTWDLWGRRRPIAFFMRALSDPNAVIPVVISTPKPFSVSPQSHAGLRSPKILLPLCSPHGRPHTLAIPHLLVLVHRIHLILLSTAAVPLSIPV